MTATLLGDKALARKLNSLSKKASKKAIVAGITASMTPIVRVMRAGVNNISSEDFSASGKKAARATINKRFKKARREDTRSAVVGFGVGKRKRAPSRGGRRGVGIGSQNIHWFVLGTKERTTSEGRVTGEMSKILEGIAKMALASTRMASLAAAKKKIAQVIEREAKKKG